MIKENLRRLMEAGSLTPEALAVRMQTNGAPVTAGAIRGWLTGGRTPNLSNTIAVAAALECSIDELVAELKAAV